MGDQTPHGRESDEAEGRMAQLEEKVQTQSEIRQTLSQQMVTIQTGLNSVLSQLNSKKVQEEDDEATPSAEDLRSRERNAQSGAYGRGWRGTQAETWGQGNQHAWVRQFPEGRHGNQLGKLDFPIFSGGDPNPWLLRAQIFFDLQEVPEENRIRVASYHLDGEAIEWFYWAQRYNRIGSWHNFCKSLMMRFGDDNLSSVNEALSKIQQKGRLDDYLREFERLANRAVSWSEDILLGAFVGGLREELGAEVRMLEPASVEGDGTFKKDK